MKVFVAGASGALGKPVVRDLVARGHNVVAMTSTPSKKPALEELGATAVVGDVFDERGMVELLRSAEPEGVVNVASKWSVQPTRTSKVRPANQIREQGARNLSAAAAAVGARRYVNESMMFVYGYGDHSKPITEDQAPGQERRRGLQDVIDAIVAAERIVLERTQNGEIEGSCVRLGFFNGRHADNAVQMVELMKKRKLPLIGKGDAVRSWIDLEDAASAITLILEGAPPGSVYNVVDDQPVAMSDYYAEIVRGTGSKPPHRLPYGLANTFASYLAPAFGRGRLPLSNAKLKAELGWQPRYPTYKDALRPLLA